MGNVFDIILLVSSISACIFCLALSRRLKTFSDKDSPLSLNIAAMSKATDETRQSISTITNDASEVAAELKVAIVGASELKNKLEALTGPAYEKLDTDLATLKSDIEKTIQQCRFVMLEAEEQAQKNMAAATELHKFQLSSTSVFNAWRAEPSVSELNDRSAARESKRLDHTSKDRNGEEYWILDDNTVNHFNRRSKFCPIHFHNRVQRS